MVRFFANGRKNILKFCSLWEEKINVSMGNTFKMRNFVFDI